MLYHTYEGYDINDELKYLLRKGEQEIMNSQLMNTYVQSGCGLKSIRRQKTHTHTLTVRNIPVLPRYFIPVTFFIRILKIVLRFREKERKGRRGGGRKTEKGKKKTKMSTVPIAKSRRLSSYTGRYTIHGSLAISEFYAATDLSTGCWEKFVR